MASTARIHRLGFDEFASLSAAALQAAGASPATIASLTRATLAAEARRKPAVGAAHLLDYLDSLRSGRLNGDPVPKQHVSRAGVITADADEGIAQLAFDQAFETPVSRS